MLILMPKNQHTQVVLQALAEELTSDFDLVPAWITQETSVDVLAEVIQQRRPNCIVLMDTAVRLYARYQRGVPTSTKHPPALILMAPFAEQVAATLVNATAITYEIPSVVQFVTLRSMLARPIRRVGVVYRTPLTSFVEKQRVLAAPEHFELVGVEVPGEPIKDQVADAVARLYEANVADCIWILNDSALLTPDLISSVWLPLTTRGRHMPILVGVSSLLSGNAKLGSFAMLPDHASLGVQAADLIFELAEDGWPSVGERPVGQPRAVRTAVDVSNARKYFGFREAAISTIDEVVE
ncbi:MAG TPA: hypothetical protein VJN18_21150 [Polyangiaceae bacterium]|nr:hypothetical protein [Polyangiaceae bacterium]